MLNEMTVADIDAYIAEKKYRPLNAAELKRGKNHLKIYGTSDPLPWSTIFTRLSAGQPIAELAYMYGHGRMITMWAKEMGITYEPQLEQIIVDEVSHRERVTALADANPEVANTLMEMVNEVAPDFVSKVALFSSELVDKSRTLLKGEYIDASDIANLAKAIQTVTDTVGVTQRHASAAQINNNNIRLEGFEFVLDTTPTDTVIEGEIDG